VSSSARTLSCAGRVTLSERLESQENDRKNIIVETTPISEHDFLVAEPVEEPKPVEEEGFWHQSKGRRHTILLFSVTLGLVVGVGVGVGNGGEFGGTSTESGNTTLSLLLSLLGQSQSPPSFCSKVSLRF
jgi:hypothetical protein